MARPPRAAAPPPAVEPRFERLLQSIGDLVRTGPTDALFQALAEVDRTIARTGDALGHSPGAEVELDDMRRRLASAAAGLELEQRRVGRDLIAVQAEIQTRARFTAPAVTSSRLDRRG